MNDVAAGLIEPLCIADPDALPRVVVSHATRHPNIFRKRVVQAEGRPASGDWVAVYSQRELEESTDDKTPVRPFAYGLYNAKSSIAVRLLRWGTPPDAAFWDGKLAGAIGLRQDLLSLPAVSDAYRLIHAEADGFPGLVVDRFGDVLSAEVFSWGIWRRAEELLQWMLPQTGAKHYRARISPAFAPQEAHNPGREEFVSDGCPSDVAIREHNVKYRVRFEGSHKTGFFCDQRDNRKQLADWAAGRSVLDLCCYTGGFAVAAAVAGASEVTAVDIDADPLVAAKKNANINQVRVKFTQADVFAYMRDMLQLGRRYDVVVLDPPKLIRSRRELEEGTRKHHDLNRLAMQLVAPGGLMLSCSCAGLLDGPSFDRLLHAAARSAGGPDHPARPIRIVKRAGAAADHPVAVHCPETEYFRSVWLKFD